MPELIMRRGVVEERDALKKSSPFIAITKAEKLESLNRRRAHLQKLLKQLDDEFAELNGKK